MTFYVLVRRTPGRRPNRPYWLAIYDHSEALDRNQAKEYKPLEGLVLEAETLDWR